jgi:hypothetical protein
MIGSKNNSGNKVVAAIAITTQNVAKPSLPLSLMLLA